MQPITISFTFATGAMAAAFLASLPAGTVSGNAPSPAAPAPSPSTAAAAPTPAADAFAATPTPSAGGIDFDRDVVNSALKPLSMKAGYDFPGFLTKLGVQKVSDLKAKTDLHSKIIDHAKAQGAYVQAA